MKLFIESEAKKEARLNTLMSLYLLKANADALKKTYEDTEYEHNFLSKIKNKLVGSQEDYDKYKVALDKYDAAVKEASKIEVEEDPINQIKVLCDDLFEKDDTFERRLVFALNFILGLDDSYPTSVLNCAFNKFSIAMGFSSENTFFDLKSSFTNNWVNINIDASYNRNMAVLAGLICLPVAAIATGGVIGVLGGTSLAGGLAATLVTGTIAAGVGVSYYYIKNEIDRTKLLEQYKELTPDETSYFLAMNVTILKFLRSTSGKETDSYKERMSFLIDYENEIHKDYFVEGINENDDNKNKVKMLESTIRLVKKLA